MTETIRRRDLRNAPAVVQRSDLRDAAPDARDDLRVEPAVRRRDLRDAPSGEHDPAPAPYLWNLKHETPVLDEPPAIAYAPMVAALISLLVSAAHLYGLGDYSAKRVGVALIAFIIGGLLMVAAQLHVRTSVIISLIAAGALMLAAPVVVFWLGS